jgi:hypothetical protein
MRIWILALMAAAATGLLIADEAQAHGRKYRVQRHIDVGIGYPYGYVYHRPYRYYYPGTYVGVEVWPRQRVRRVRTRESADVRLKELYVYPAAGQSERQLADDRSACHLWSVDRTGFDPTLGAGTLAQADAYGRALTACLEARDYVVR